MVKACNDWTSVIIVLTVCVFGIVGYYIYIDYHIKMLVQTPDKKNKITIKILAAGFTLAHGAMQFSTSKQALNFQFYSINVELYAIVNALIFLGMIVFGLITGGTYLTNFKGKQDDTRD